MRRIDKGEVQRRSEEEKEEEGRRGGGGDVWPAKPKIFIIWPFREKVCQTLFCVSHHSLLTFLSPKILVFLFLLFFVLVVLTCNYYKQCYNEFFFLVLFRAAFTAYGGSQARGLIRAVAASRKARSEPCLRRQI